MGVRAIGERVSMHYNQVAKWRRRYIRSGLGALQDEPRSGVKGNISTELLRQIVDQATRPPQGRARWTCRAMARELGVSKATVQRVWSENEIKPHLTRVFKLSTIVAATYHKFVDMSDEAAWPRVAPAPGAASCRLSK